MNYLTASKEQLIAEREALMAKYNEFKAKGLKLDMSRGKPSAAQLDESEGLLTVLSKNEDTIVDGLDTRNYGILDGIVPARKLFAELLEVPFENVIVGGNSSLTFMYDTIMRLCMFGAAGVNEPWFDCKDRKFLCPVPGYDRHFTITEQFGFEMINIPMDENGPDMDMVEKLVAEDASIKGIWCVPKYTNPEGVVYSDEVVHRLANLKPAAKDFRIMWDNAYCVHTISQDDKLANIFTERKAAGNEDMFFEYTSTSKITYPGAGVCAFVASDANIAWTKKLMNAQAISADKVNQLRHVKFFKNAQGILDHMKKHAAILKPKFDMVLSKLDTYIKDAGVGQWKVPNGGYFVAYAAYPGTAKAIFAMCKEAGLVITNAGAVYPYGKDPQDSILRIAPSLPPVSELEVAMDLFCTCALITAIDKILETK